MAAALEALGYCYIQRDGPSDLVLRQKADQNKGFEWKDQAHYDRLGDAVVAFVQEQLVQLCGLEMLKLPKDTAPQTTIYASPGLSTHKGPVVVLVCGSAPGGAAGVWGRSICINHTLRDGAMFEYIAKAKERGWGVVVTNPGVNEIDGAPVPGSECPHRHFAAVWKEVIAPAPASSVLIVAHSYGGPGTVYLLKTLGEERNRIAAVAFTDAGAFDHAGTLLQEDIPSEETLAAAKNRAKAEAERKMMLRYRELAPESFAPPSPEVLAFLHSRARNFVVSDLPTGEGVHESHEGCVAVSAGHKEHPWTSASAMDHVMAFLEVALTGGAEASNEALRAQIRK
eukprot:Sspe_Gene.89599::Locus_61344_Transcript_1_1_Confidence_1.000_Length_1539::g.89599::m.89599